MSGPEHFQEAEYQSRMAIAAWPDDRDLAMYNLGQAQVHATLALAAATALHGPQGLPCADRKAWHEAAAVPARSERAA